MKRFLCISLVFAIAVFIAGNLLASSVDYLGPQSAEYIRTFNRNAATDSADGVNYNPAGVVKMKDGLYVNASGQYLMKKFTAEDNLNTTLNPDKYESDTPSIIPNAYALYKQNNWAAFAAFTVPAGGGKVEYDNGTPMVRTGVFGAVYQYAILTGNPPATANALAFTAANNVDSLKMNSQYLAGTLGGAYKINEMFSVSLGARYINAKKTIDVDAKTPNATYTVGNKIVSVDLDAYGFGGIIGLDITPMKDLNVGIRWETVTPLEWDTSVSGSTLGKSIVTGLGYKDGEKEKKDLPSLLGLGVSYDILPELKISSSFTYYFIKQANWRHYDGKKTNKEYDNGYDAGLALEYKVLPQLLVSAGYLHTKIGGNNKTWNDFEIALDYNSYALGARYEAIPGLNINLGFSWSIYKDSTTHYPLSGTPQNIKYTKDVKVIALGAEYKVM